MDKVAQEVNQRIGQRVRLLRLGRGKPMHANELARKAGLSPERLSRIENGHEDLRISTVHHLADALGVPLPILFEEVGSEGQRPVQ